MKTLEKGQDKIKKICEVLREETLEPAHKEAQQILKEAQNQAERILEEARQEAERLHKEAKASIDQEKNVFEASLLQATKQSLEALRQSIEGQFFNQRLSSLIDKHGAEPHLIANLMNAIVDALKKEGITANLTGIVPKTIEPRTVNELLLQDVLTSLNGRSVTLGNFGAGVQVKVADKKMTIDISDSALRELLAAYVVRKDFRKLIFES